jgi:hypothetical protein
MSRAVKQVDITRALKAARSLGMDIAGYEVTADGTVRVMVGKPGNITTVINPLDQWMATHAGKA